MEIYARISFKHFPYINSKAEKRADIYRLIEHNNEMYWARVTILESLTTNFNYMFYINTPPNKQYIKFEEWHLTKLATRYYQYKKETK